jgi:N-acetylmuramoyl-L-alanine amidase
MLLLSTSAFRWGPIPDNANAVDHIVLDPGHGGRDPGALGRSSKEKDIALKISLMVEKSFKDNYPGIKVELTRRTDVFVGLMERAEFANTRNADLFISIHLNANTSTAPHGSETYALGLHRTPEQFEVMRRENGSILLEENHQQTYEGFDPNSEEATIIFRLRQHAFLRQSLDLAARIENQFKINTQRTSRGVKQAGYLVLWKTTMPAVLVETGFISNPSDETFLNSAEGQRYIANSIYKAVLEYRNAN